MDLQDLKELASDELPGFNDRLKTMLPSLIEHRCSVGERGGFFQRLERGTYMAHIFEHVVLELQTLVGSVVGYGKTRETHTKEGVYKIGIEYDDEELVRAASEVGRDVCMAAITGEPFDLPGKLDLLRAIWERNKPSRLLAELLREAKSVRVPARVLNGEGLVQLGHSARQRRVMLNRGMTDLASGVGVGIAGKRELARTILKAAGIPVSQEEPELPVSHRLLVIGNHLITALDAAGGDVTETVHPTITQHAIDAAFALKLDIAAIEIATPDLGQPLEAVSGVVLGVNAEPDLPAFAYPTEGVTRPIAKAILDLLFPEPMQSRIPVVAVTGTNGKTTTTRLVAHLFEQVYGNVGMTCTEGIYVGNRRIESGDCSGPKSARLILQHPEPQAAALETARGGILREGLGFDRCDVAIVTNIADGDHLGTSDILTPEALAGVKETIVWAVAPWGAAVLNATDPLVVNMKRLCDGEVVYFARKESEPVLAEHRAAGGKAIFVRGNIVILANGAHETGLIDLARVPLTHGGLVGFQVENVLAATAAAWHYGLPLEAIRRGLETFAPNIDQVPARFNLLQIRGATVIGDYGHNTSSLQRLLEVFAELPHPFRTAVYSAAGDRRDSDILEQAQMLGNFFDRVILYEDTCRRGRQPGEITALFQQGLAKGSRVKEVREITSGLESISAAIAAATSGELILLQLDLVDDALSMLKNVLHEGGREVTLGEAVAAIHTASEVTLPEETYMNEYLSTASTPAARSALHSFAGR